MLNRPTCERPLAIAKLTSYRYPGSYGWIMIGANSADEALSEARRSMTRTNEPLCLDKLEIWDGDEYIPVRCY